MSFKFPLASSSWDKKEYAAMQRVIDSDIFTMGVNVKEFEKQFAKYVGSNYCIMVNSGSSANLLMIASLFYCSNSSLRLERGDEVIVPPVSWSTTYYPLLQYGLKLRFVDIDVETLNYDLDQLEEAVTERTRLIVAVNLLGNPNDYVEINKIIGQKDIILVEDNCEAMGAEFSERKTGTFGLMGSFSTFFSHHISTMEGGLIVTNDEELYHILLSLRAHGWTRDLPKNNYVCGEKSDDPFKESFRFVLPGYNVRPLELSGSIGLEQLKKLPCIIDSRRENARLFVKALDGHPDILIQSEIGKSSWFGFSLVVRPGSPFTREKLLGLLSQRGFETRPIVAGNFINNEVIKYFELKDLPELKNAGYVGSNGLFIGNHHFSMDEAIESLASI